MMIKSLADLHPEFKEKLDEVIVQCHQDGFWVVPYMTIRDPWEQAKLWRRSRTFQQCSQMIKDLKTADAEFLAECFLDVGSQPTAPWATNAIPGLSWHQWGEAADCYIQGKDGSAIWDSAHPGYECYATRAKERGLEAGHFWKSKDSVHVQFRKGRVLEMYSLSEVDSIMIERFYKQ